VFAMLIHFYQDVKVFIQSATQLPANKQVCAHRFPILSCRTPYRSHKSALLSLQRYPHSILETDVGRARRAQGFAHAGILQCFVRFRVFTAAEDTRRQIDKDESLMRTELQKFETCAIFLQQVVEMLIASSAKADKSVIGLSFEPIGLSGCSVKQPCHF
jgi:hypothetical protein